MPLLGTRGAGSTKGFGFTGGPNAKFVTATGGTITTDGDYKIHTFTGSSTFTVTDAGNENGSQTIDYLVIAGGAGTNPSTGGTGGGGAGGYRINFPNPAFGGTPVSVTSYPITVGGGGSGADGNPSTAFGITSTGGGRGGWWVPGVPQTQQKIYGTGNPGGSGGGAMTNGTYQSLGGVDQAIGKGIGNSPPVTPSQGSNGGWATTNRANYETPGSGGGAAQAGEFSSPNPGENTTIYAPPRIGGNGRANSITGSSTYYSGGGGGASYGPGSGQAPPVGGAGGLGGGGRGGAGSVQPAQPGTANTGGGGGAKPWGAPGSSGGSGVVIIRYKYK